MDFSIILSTVALMSSSPAVFQKATMGCGSQYLTPHSGEKKMVEHRKIELLRSISGCYGCLAIRWAGWGYGFQVMSHCNKSQYCLPKHNSPTNLNNLSPLTHTCISASTLSGCTPEGGEPANNDMLPAS